MFVKAFFKSNILVYSAKKDGNLYWTNIIVLHPIKQKTLTLNKVSNKIFYIYYTYRLSINTECIKSVFF